MEKNSFFATALCIHVNNAVNYSEFQVLWLRYEFHIRGSFDVKMEFLLIYFFVDVIQ